MKRSTVTQCLKYQMKATAHVSPNHWPMSHLITGNCSNLNTRVLL